MPPSRAGDHIQAAVAVITGLISTVAMIMNYGSESSINSPQQREPSLARLLIVRPA